VEQWGRAYGVATGVGGTAGAMVSLEPGLSDHPALILVENCCPSFLIGLGPRPPCMGKRRMTRQNKDLAEEHKEEMIAHDSSLLQQEAH